jgi:hypothetical protein
MKGYRGFESKEAYEAYYSDPANYADEIPMMEDYVKEAEKERQAVNLPFERLPQHAGDPGFGPVPNVIPIGSKDPNHPSNIPEKSGDQLVNRPTR